MRTTDEIVQTDPDFGTNPLLSGHRAEIKGLRGGAKIHVLVDSGMGSVDVMALSDSAAGNGRLCELTPNDARDLASVLRMAADEMDFGTGDK